MRPKTHPWNHLLSGDLGMFAATFPRTAERIKDAIYSAIEQDQHAALRAEVEAHKTRADFWQLAKSSDFHRDAMRYRWLRSTGLSHINFEGLTCDTCDVGLDYAIDAAMQGDA